MLQELINKLNEAMSAIQSLQLQPTEYNCSRIVTALNAIQAAAQIGGELSQKIMESEKKIGELVRVARKTEEDPQDEYHIDIPPAIPESDLAERYQDKKMMDGKTIRAGMGTV